MITADAYTNPFTYRRCAHVHSGVERPSRCLACGAVDHGFVEVGKTSRGRMLGTGMGSFIGGVDEVPAAVQAESSSLCPKGHPMQHQRYTRLGQPIRRSVCQTCRVAK